MKMIKKQPHKSMERLSGNVQGSESDTEESPVISPYFYKEMYRQMNEAFFLLITVFDTKIRNLPALRIAPKRHCFHCFCNWVCWTSYFSISVHTNLTKKDVESWAGKKPDTKREDGRKNAIFMLRESGS